MFNIIDYKKIVFLKSLTNFSFDKEFSNFNIWIFGRSNSGKSSIINTISGKKKLSRVSKIPGCTKFVNIFGVKNFRIFDFPGYGYAKISKNRSIYINNFLKKCLKNVKKSVIIILVMDIRNPISKLDKLMINLLVIRKLSFLVLLSKIDKVKKFFKISQLYFVKNFFKSFKLNCEIIFFSTFDKNSILFLKKKLIFLLRNGFY